MTVGYRCPVPLCRWVHEDEEPYVQTQPRPDADTDIRFAMKVTHVLRKSADGKRQARVQEATCNHLANHHPLYSWILDTRFYYLLPTRKELK